MFLACLIVILPSKVSLIFLILCELNVVNLYITAQKLKGCEYVCRKITDTK